VITSQSNHIRSLRIVHFFRKLGNFIDVTSYEPTRLQRHREKKTHLIIPLLYQLLIIFICHYISEPYKVWWQWATVGLFHWASLHHTPKGGSRILELGQCWSDAL